MTTISYTRTFHHKLFIDGVTRVSASGDDGFNGRFQGIEAEFDTISGKVSEINGQFGTVATQISALGIAVARAVSVAPVLTATGPNGWKFGFLGQAGKPDGATGAAGAVPVTLPAGPAGGKITAFRACGTNSGTGHLSLMLIGNKLNLTASGVVADIEVTGQQGVFDITKNPVSGSGTDVIDAESCYFIMAILSEAGANDTVILSGFQVLYEAR